MELQIQDLVSSIRKDGIEAANAEAEAIISEAKKKAETIVADAKAEAKSVQEASEKRSVFLKKALQSVQSRQKEMLCLHSKLRYRLNLKRFFQQRLRTISQTQLLEN